MGNSCDNRFEDEQDMKEVENKGVEEDVTDQDKKEKDEEIVKEEGEEKKEKEKGKVEKEEEEDLEYLRLNCTRMSTRRATNFSQVCHHMPCFISSDRSSLRDDALNR